MKQVLNVSFELHMYFITTKFNVGLSLRNVFKYLTGPKENTAGKYVLIETQNLETMV